MTTRTWIAGAAASVVLVSGCAASTRAGAPVATPTVTATVATTAAASTSASSTPAATAAAAAPTTTTTLAVSPEGLAATLERYREDDVTNTIQVQMVNQADSIVRIADLRLVWPGLSDQPSSGASYLVAPGEHVDLPVPAGQANCADPPRFDEPLPVAPAVAMATATFEHGAPHEVRIPVTDVRGVLGRVFLPECQGRAVADTATIAFDPTWTDATVDGQAVALGTLRLTRNRGTAAVTVKAVLGTVLLRIAPQTPSDGPFVALAEGQREASVPVVLGESGDCRPHALADSKHTFFLRAVVDVGPLTDTVLYVLPDPGSQPQLLRMINRACGVG